MCCKILGFILMEMSFLKQISFSRGVNINFKNEKDSNDFCYSFEEWRKDAVVQGACL